jgi:hypothetical protein
MPDAALADTADPRRRRVPTVSLRGAIIVLLDVSFVDVALPSIERGFGVPPGGCSGWWGATR